MADDAEQKPSPGQSRRRTDIDPTLTAPARTDGRRRSDPRPDTAALAAGHQPDDAPTTRFLIPEVVHGADRTQSADGVSVTARGQWLPTLDERSADPGVCPFLRAVGDAAELVSPIETPDPANRCAALREAVPQSLRQQELVCLVSGHVNCPRYLRGAVVVAATPESAVRAGGAVTPAMLGSVILLVLAFAASVGFVMSRGGMELIAATPTASPAASVTAAAVVPSPSVGPATTELAAPSASATVSPSRPPSPSPRPTVSASPSPTSPPTAAPNPKPTPRPEPTSDRYALLRPCPGTPRCWIYRVRAGDNLYSIANYFGVSLDSIYDRNPWVRNGLQPGRDLRLPPPTR